MRHKGFTLLEVLVVIAVIAVLLAIATPALQKGKEQSRNILCTNNLRQLGFAASIHTQENRFYPYGFNGLLFSQPPGDYLKYASDDFQGWWWFHYLDSAETIDTSANGTLWCPARRLKDGVDRVNILCSNYGINYSISKIANNNEQTEFEGTPLSPGRVRSPASTLLLMDSGYALISWKALAEDTAVYSFENPDRQSSFYLPGLKLNKNRPTNTEQQEDAIDGRHSRKKVNMTFADGHVDGKKASRLAVDFDSQGTISNKSAWVP